MNTQDENRITAAPNTMQKSRRRWLGYSLASLAGFIGATGISAVAMGGPDGWCDRGQQRMHWTGRKQGQGFEPGMMQEFAERRIDHVLQQIDATPEQRQQVKEILGKAFQERIDHRLERRQILQDVIDLLSQPQIDRASLERLRDEKLKQVEQMSGRMTQLLADAAEVLTAEQRARLGELIAQRGLDSKHNIW